MVGAMNATPKNATTDKKAWFSNAGPGVDIFAAGDQILSSTSNISNYTTSPYFNNAAYRQVNFPGTSMASPQICGIGATFLQKNLTATPAQFKTWLKVNATPTMFKTGLANDYSNTESQYGGDAYAAYSNNTPTTPVTPPTTPPSTPPTTPPSVGVRIWTGDNGYAHATFKRLPAILDRSITKSNKVLILYDLNSVLPNRYYNDVSPASGAATLSARETILGANVTVITSYSAFLALSDSAVALYSHIWDIGYDTLIPAAVEDKYSRYLTSGGAIFFLGENGNFVIRDNDITNFITNMGGGSIAIGSDIMAVEIATIAPEFRLSNQTPTVTLNAPGRFSTIGTGTAIASSSSGDHAAVWKTGSLSNQLSGAIVSVLDVNFIIYPNNRDDFIDNLCVVLNKA
jgi:hypothetical protein